jgi:hypothetical protein
MAASGRDTIFDGKENDRKEPSMPRITFDTIKLKLKALKDTFFRKKTIPMRGPERFYISPKKRIIVKTVKCERCYPSIISTAFYGKAAYRLWMRQVMKTKKRRIIPV